MIGLYYLAVAFATVCPGYTDGEIFPSEPPFEGGISIICIESPRIVCEEVWTDDGGRWERAIACEGKTANEVDIYLQPRRRPRPPRIVVDFHGVDDDEIPEAVCAYCGKREACGCARAAPDGGADPPKVRPNWKYLPCLTQRGEVWCAKMFAEDEDE